MLEDIREATDTALELVASLLFQQQLAFFCVGWACLKVFVVIFETFNY